MVGHESESECDDNDNDEEQQDREKGSEYRIVCAIEKEPHCLIRYYCYLLVCMHSL